MFGLDPLVAACLWFAVALISLPAIGQASKMIAERVLPHFTMVSGITESHREWLEANCRRGYWTTGDSVARSYAYTRITFFRASNALMFKLMFTDDVKED